MQDYGLATFDQVLAQAAGGYESEQALAKLARLFAAQRVRFGASPSVSDCGGGGRWPRACGARASCVGTAVCGV
jgi:hypothetical protein